MTDRTCPDTGQPVSTCICMTHDPDGAHYRASIPERFKAGPQHDVARQFMARKGYSLARPVSVDKLDDQPCWYYVYRLPDGVLELEVSWDGSEWQTLVTTWT